MKMRCKRFLAFALSAAMVLSLVPATAMAAGTAGPDAISKDDKNPIYLDYSEGIAAGAYKWIPDDAENPTYYCLTSVDKDGNEVYATYKNFRGQDAKTLVGTYTSSVVTNTEFQNMKIYVPAEYMSKGKDGSVSINYKGVKAGYTAHTAPVVLQTNNGSWKSGTSDPKKENLPAYIDAGLIYVSCGSRSRDAEFEGLRTGKSPAEVVDLKAGVIALRANADVLPGDMDKIFSTGNSGAGQSSTILGAAGDMEEYYPYLAETGAIGVTPTSSEYSDAILGMYATAQIADIENADIAYAWWRTVETAVTPMGPSPTPQSFNEFQLQLQKDMAAYYVEYLNGLNLGLTLESERSGSYYDAILQNMTDAINVYLADLDNPAGYIDYLLTTNVEGQPWVEKVSDKEVKVIDLDGWVLANGTVSDGTYADAYNYDVSPNRNKKVPDFDSMDRSAENDAFGKATEAGVHYSDSVSAVLKANLETYKTLDGYADVAAEVEDYLTIDKDVMYQADLLNAMEILAPGIGLDSENPAKYWRSRNGVQDQHTSFSIAYNSALAAEKAGCEVDYALVWAAEHNDLEKRASAVAEFIDWVKACSAKEDSSDPWSIEDAEVTEYTFTIDNANYDVTRYTDYYLDKTGNIAEAQFANALVNVYVPANATDDSPILYMVNNSGWQSNGYSDKLLSEGTNIVSTDKGNMAALALKQGMIVVDAGLRSRSDAGINHSPVTVADAKAVIRYLRYNEIGNTDEIFITGTSGGGALSVAIGSNGNSADFYEELYKIGAAGMKDAETSTINDDIYGVIAYCPITDLGHADGSYEFTYAGARQEMINDGYTANEFSNTFALSELTMEMSPILAADWAEYVNAFGLLNEDGEAVVAEFDAAALASTGTLMAGTEELMIACFQKALDELGYDALMESILAREAAGGYKDGTPHANWKTEWITFSADKKTVEAIDMEGLSYYVALGQVLKPGIAFTNKGIPAFQGLFFNENNLFGQADEKYGYLTEEVFLESDMYAENGGTYKSWDEYWAANGELVTKQANMTDSIYYLTSEDGDTAPYWFVRHGSNDRDTSFANQTLLYFAMLNDESIETLDFAFEFGLGHTGGYALEEVDTFIAKSLGGVGYRPTIDAADEPGTDEPGTDEPGTTVPDTDGDKDNDGVKDEDEKSPTTADSFGFLAVVVVAAAGLAFAARRRVAR